MKRDNEQGMEPEKNDGRLLGAEDKASCKMRKGEIDGSNRAI